MNRVLKLQRVGLINPTVVEYEGKVLATNQLDIESTCNLWRCHFGFYPTEKIDLAMTKKNFSVIQQKTLSSVKSVYDLFYERNFIPRVFDSNEEVSKWDMYRTNEVEKLKAENATLREKVFVSDRAFSNLVHEMYENGIRPVCDEKFFIESRLKDAEKELAEEGKDDNK